MTARNPKKEFICDVCGKSFLSPNPAPLYCHNKKCKAIGMDRRKWVSRHGGAPYPLSARRNPSDAQNVE
jgi:hypothetical protein